MQLHKLLALVLGVCSLTFLAACTEAEKDAASAQTVKAGQQRQLTVYKSPTCGCCGEWVEHLEARGFSSQIQHPENLELLKDQYQIGRDVRSCHTAVSKDGYVFEGHIPGRYISAFLENPPAGAIGLAVPGMPLGSPGMEVGDRFTPYQILLLKSDGSHEVFASIDSADQQY